jgi:hypothetical protein
VQETKARSKSKSKKQKQKQEAKASCKKQKQVARNKSKVQEAKARCKEQKQVASLRNHATNRARHRATHRATYHATQGIRPMLALCFFSGALAHGKAAQSWVEFYLEESFAQADFSAAKFLLRHALVSSPREPVAP